MSTNYLSLPISGAIAFSVVRTAMNREGETFSFSDTRNFPSVPSSGAVAASDLYNYLNVHGPALALDANVITTVGTWNDLSGNGYNFLYTSNTQSNINGIAHISCTGTTGAIKRVVGGVLTDIPTATNRTIIVFSALHNSTSDYRTLVRGAARDHYVLVGTGTNNLGMFDNDSGTFFSSGYSLSNIDRYTTNFNMLVFKISTATPQWQFQFNDRYVIETAMGGTSLAATDGFAAIGCNHNVSASLTNSTQGWGRIAMFLCYNSHLTSTQIGDIYARFAPRYVYHMPPSTTGLVGYYTGESWSNTQWLDVSGSNNHCTTTVGTISTYRGSLTDSNNAIYQGLNGLAYLGGDSNAGITFPVSINSNYTLIHLARYSGNGPRERIFDSASFNWLSGFWEGSAGVSFHDGWVNDIADAHGNNWVLSVDQQSYYRSNGVNRTRFARTVGTRTITINNGIYNLERSDWLCACVILYNRLLTVSQILQLECWLVDKYNLYDIAPNLYPLNRITTAARNSLRGAYALFRLSYEYKGPVVKIVYSSSSYDMYSDAAGDLNTHPNGTGRSLADITFTAGPAFGQAFIDTWYDQSGNGRHATQSNTSIQPYIDLDNGIFVDFGNTSTRYLDMPVGTVPTGTLNASYTFLLKHGAIINTSSGGFIGAGSNVNNQTNNLRCAATLGYVNYWWNNDLFFGTTTPTRGVVCVTYDGTNRQGFVNRPYTATASSGYTLASSPQYIGKTSFNEFLNGQLYYMFIFGAALSETNRLALMAADDLTGTIVEYPPITLAGPTGLTGSASIAGHPYGNGTYTYTASSQFSTSSDVPGNAFDKLIATNSWWSTAARYNTSTGAYTGALTTTVSGTAYAGEWIQLQCPTAFVPVYILLYEYPDRNAVSEIVAGSTNGSTWTLLNFETTVPALSGYRHIYLNTTTAYNYYRYIIRSINPANGSGLFTLTQMAVFGAPS